MTSQDREHGNIIGAALVGAVCLVFTSLWWNRYLSPMTSGELFSLIALDHNWLPYRDYFYQATPAGPLILGWLGQAIGPSLIAVWAIASLFNILAAATLFILLRKFTSRVGATFAAITAYVIAAGDLADTPPWYFHLVAAFCIFALYSFLKAFQTSNRSSVFLWCLLSGLWSGLALGFRQTAILPILAFIFTPAALAVRQSDRRGWAAISISGMLIGITTVSLPFLIYLYDNQAFSLFVDQAFVSGPSSKGPLLDTLFRPFTSLIIYSPHQTPALATIILLSTSIIIIREAKRETGITSELDTTRRGLRISIAILVFVVCMTLAMWALGTDIDLNILAGGLISGRTPGLVFAGLTSLGSVVIFFAFTLKLWRSNDREMAEKWTITFVSAALTYSFTISWALGEIVAFPGLGVVMAVFLGALQANNYHQKATPRRVYQLTILLLSVAILFGGWRKLSVPENWCWWQEPATSNPGHAINISGFDGFRVSGSTSEFFEKIQLVIRDYVRPGDKIFAYPVMSVLYGMARAPSPTRCLSHWFDICPDDIAIADARRLTEEPPVLIVSANIPPWAYPLHEDLFRNGKPSGQQTLWATLTKLEQDRYHEIVSMETATSGIYIHVWVRSDRWTAEGQLSQSTKAQRTE